MKKRAFVDWKWTQIGIELKGCDPQRFAAVMEIAEEIVSAHREASVLASTCRPTPSNDNR